MVRATRNRQINWSRFLVFTAIFVSLCAGAQAQSISRAPDSFSDNSSLTIGATALDTEDYTGSDHPGATSTYVPANEFYADHPTTNGGGPQFLTIVWDETGISGATISSATLDLSGWVDGGFWKDTTE